MKIISIFLLLMGSFLIIYAVFSRFYGEPSIAFKQFRSLSFLVLANSTLILCLIAMHFQKYFK
ncbi:MAG: hypothetical protein Q8O13_03100 [Candidatus Omnitrophota bacterium]|nr:hypothetical protein [Candidatus Omnitrophota bacterium]